MRYNIVAKNVLDVIVNNHIRHVEKISREEMSSADNHKKRVLPVLYLYSHLHSYKNVSVLNISQLFTTKRSIF